MTRKITKRLETFRIRAEIILAHDDPNSATYDEFNSLKFYQFQIFRSEELRRPVLNRIIRSYQSLATMVSFYRLPRWGGASNHSSEKEKFVMDDQTLDYINSTLTETGPAVLGIGLKNVMTT